MIKLKEFQAKAASTIAQRYAFFAGHPERPFKGPKPRPFFQALSAITGAGKTPILAQAISDIRSMVKGEPIVFWMSKAKTVVAQTHSNFADGGKYAEIIDGFKPVTVSQLTPELISDSSTALLILATTGLFNQEDQEEGGLNIYKTGADKFGGKSAWNRLIERDHNGIRRPLFIVYDEGHNFSEQQTKILRQLEPEAYLLASATLKLPELFYKEVIFHINSWFEDVESENADALIKLGAVNPKNGRASCEHFTTTTVHSEKVVEAQLIKRAIQFDGTTAPLEQSLDSLIDRLDIIENEIELRSLNFKPKAIYVCNTNMVGGEPDDHTKPFILRNASPIKIWRYLVDVKKIAPNKIAVYANLKFSDKNKPEEFKLFSKKDSDFDEFTAGDYQHIIFNQALQEGWDDPACYVAYIDKSMGSSIQVEQIIGRVLRQYGAEHYDNANLNSAHFFLRVDDENVFTNSIKSVKKKLEDQGSPIEIIDNFSYGKSASYEIEKKPAIDVNLCHVNVDAIDACLEIKKIVDESIVFKEGDENTVALAKIGTQQMDLTNLSESLNDMVWVTKGNTNPIRLRWLISTALRARSTRALAVTDLQNQKFDVKVQMQSRAHNFADDLSQKITSAYFNHSKLIYETESPFIFGKMRVSSNAKTFRNGLYEAYDKLNNFESTFADALDDSGFVWHRNPSAGGFHIPLLSDGDTGAFYPDFVVWKENKIYCLDTKGKHLLTDAVARKLFDITDDEEKPKIHVRFISEGEQKAIGVKAVGNGYTVWKMKSGNPYPIHVKTISDAVKECIK
ncbi:DEAD/DEAH box helicase family protein [Enterobacter hormaechei]|uniref:DEAD/DEAH box helicase family protein n=1 Tax=Enterobacter roggenkampii TaxID=1812935 RepID=UPI00244C0368|nr:DEAD/DEAH box helicase family protein [Enterobacter roggenkampii]MDG9879362.1 DEAD/DEAH box helicase family protein [Enterobacter roggenkampii]